MPHELGFPDAEQGEEKSVQLVNYLEQLCQPLADMLNPCRTAAEKASGVDRRCTLPMKRWGRRRIDAQQTVVPCWPLSGASTPDLLATSFPKALAFLRRAHVPLAPAALIKLEIAERALAILQVVVNQLDLALWRL
jgi:hypothetical protein